MPGEPRLRASDADRERTVELLREHHAVGRLTADEFHERLDRAYAAKTRGDLDELLADLPAIDLYRLPSADIRPTRRRGSGPLRQVDDGSLLPARSAPLLTWGAVSLVLTAAWLVAGVASGGAAWIPWFLVIVIPWALALARRRPGGP
jgi:Domain of unknown function (DUF1707)